MICLFREPNPLHPSVPLPGFITVERGDILQTTALEIGHEGVVAIYVVRNPDKLRHMADTVH